MRNWGLLVMPANRAVVQVQVQDSHCGVVWSNIAKVSPVENTSQIKPVKYKSFNTTPHHTTIPQWLAQFQPMGEFPPVVRGGCGPLGGEGRD